MVLVFAMTITITDTIAIAIAIKRHCYFSPSNTLSLVVQLGCEQVALPNGTIAIASYSLEHV
jgi:hypothetical protein